MNPHTLCDSVCVQSGESQRDCGFAGICVFYGAKGGARVSVNMGVCLCAATEFLIKTM